MGNYASFAAAREADDSLYRRILRITLADPDSQAPTNQTLLGDTGPVLVLSDVGGGLYKWSSGATNYVEPAVLDWGQISTSGDCGSAFESATDLQVRLSNAKLNGQLDNASLTFAAGSASESPAMSGDEVRLSHLFGQYTPTTLTVTLYIESRYFTNSDSDRKELVLFTGIVNTVAAEGDDLVIDAVQNETILDTSLPGREITDSPDLAANGSRAPIVYGTCTLSTTELKSFSPETAICAGAIIPVVPAVALSTSSGTTDYIYNDCKGPNTGWTDQPDWTTSKSSTFDRAYIIDPNTMTWGVVVEGGSGSGTADFIDGATANEQLVFRVTRYAVADAYVRAVEVIGDDGLTDDDNLFNNDINSYASLDVGSTSKYVDLGIGRVSPLGDGIVQDDAVTGWIMTDSVTLSGTPAAEFGMWRPTPADWYDYGTAGVEGQLSDTEMEGGNFYDQRDENTATISANDYTTDSGGNLSPLILWRWEYPNGSGTGIDQIYLRIKISTAGTGGEKLRLISAGFRIRFRVVRGQGNLPIIMPPRSGGGSKRKRG